MSTATELQRIINSKAAIKTAIENKGVTVGTGTIDTYAAKIDEIGTVVVKDFLVRFFDYDGTILKEQWVYSGETATAPTTPTHQYLTFAEWNNTFTNVTEDIDTGAIYNTTDGKTYLFITLNAVTGLAPTLYFNKSTTSLMTIDWGDGQTSTSTTSGNQNLSHTYATYGDYIITVDNSNGSNFIFGYGTSAATIFGDYSTSSYRFILTKIYLGNFLSTFNGFCFGNQRSLKKITIPKTVTSMANANGTFFSSCVTLNCLVLPTTVTTLISSIGEGMLALKYMILPKTLTSFSPYMINGASNRLYTNLNNSITSIGSNSFASNSLIEKQVIKTSVTSIGSNAFLNNYSCCCYLCYPTTPPTLGTTVFSGINSLAKIYVPDSVVDTYKSATGWIAYANYIYPLSTYIPN